MSAEPQGPGPEAVVRVVLRPIGSPLALGFLALAAGTVLLSGEQLGWLDAADDRAVALALLAFVAPLQLLTSLLAFLARDSVVGTGMGILAGTWATIALVTLTVAPGATDEALGTFLVVSGAALAIPAVGAALGKVAAAAVLGLAAVRFTVTGVYELTASGAWKDAAGVLGLLLAAVAFYAALAFSLEDVRRGRGPLPVGRRGGRAAALTGELSAQLQDVEHEAGVRGAL